MKRAPLYLSVQSHFWQNGCDELIRNRMWLEHIKGKVVWDEFDPYYMTVRLDDADRRVDFEKIIDVTLPYTNPLIFEANSYAMSYLDNLFPPQ